MRKWCSASNASIPQHFGSCWPSKCSGLILIDPLFMHGFPTLFLHRSFEHCLPGWTVSIYLVTVFLSLNGDADGCCIFPSGFKFKLLEQRSFVLMTFVIKLGAFASTRLKTGCETAKYTLCQKHHYVIICSQMLVSLVSSRDGQTSKPVEPALCTFHVELAEISEQAEFQ